jgi:hypothetical protein
MRSEEIGMGQARIGMKPGVMTAREVMERLGLEKRRHFDTLIATKKKHYFS